MTTFLSRITYTIITLSLIFGLEGLGIETPTSPFTSISDPDMVSVEGVISIIWGDSINGTNYFELYLTDATGRKIRLVIDENKQVVDSKIASLNGKRVLITGRWLYDSSMNSNQTLVVSDINSGIPIIRNFNSGSFITGSQRWISILCKFSDIPEEPEPLPFFQQMYANSYPYLDDYWREQSYDVINLAGSYAVGWYNLPHPTSYYYYDHGSGYEELDLSRLTQDCTAVADNDVFFPDFVGINIFYNLQRSGTAYGGGTYLTLDGISRSWRMTWLGGSWGIRLDTVEHEMGHAFGLPHSLSARFGEYGNYWDVMSYGCGWYCQFYIIENGVHTIAINKYNLGWIPDSQVIEVGNGTSQVIKLERLALPQTLDYKMIRIPIAGSNTHFYTVEARQRVGYDWGVRYQAAIIHEIDTTKYPPATVMERNFYYEGFRPISEQDWIPGNIFNDTQNGIKVCVNSATVSGMVVTVANGLQIECSFQPNLSSSTIYGEQLVQSANYRFTITLPNYGITATNVIVTATIPNHTNYIQGSATTNQGTITEGSPLVFNIGTLGYEIDTLDYSPVTVNFDVSLDTNITSPTVLTSSAEITWDNDSLYLTGSVIANSIKTYLPILEKSK